MPYHLKYPDQCPTLYKWAKKGIKTMSKTSIRRLNDMELCCVLVYTARKYCEVKRRENAESVKRHRDGKRRAQSYEGWLFG